MVDYYGIKKVQFVIMHPPYWDIIKFSEDKRDLSNSETLEEFLAAFNCLKPKQKTAESSEAEYVDLFNEEK
jgi:hypothetical protein